MKIKNLVILLCLMPVVAFAADNSARVGMVRAGGVGAAKKITTSATPKKVPAAGAVEKTQTPADVQDDVAEDTEDFEEIPEDVEEVEVVEVKSSKQSSAKAEDCREVYQACMDDFCLLDEAEGGRCACSDNIERSKKLIQEIQKIQSEADDLYTTGVEREKLGAKARLVFGESEAAKKSAAKSGIDFSAWLMGSDDEDELDELDEDVDIGQGLYDMAADACQEELKRCGNKSKAEEMVYNRLIVADCKSFNTYLSDQKRDATANKKTAEAAVRAARLEMLDTTNKYNRGECLLVYRSCIADKGGCGVNFENCLDEGLLTRRSHACEDVLDQCMAVRKDVLKDWEDESDAILKDAAKYADRNQRATCLAKIQNCLEEGCSTSTESMCLSDVKVAAGICPIITECNEKIPGLQSVVNDKLGYLQVKFCENDIDSCLKEKCGADFTKPECVGKEARVIADTMCPQRLFPSCKTMSGDNFEIIVSSAMLHMDYQLLTGCINQFAEKLTNVCGTDMACIPASQLLEGIDTTKWADVNALSAQITQSSNAAVDKFFTDFQKDLTLSACQDVYSKSGRKLKNRTSMIDGVNTAAKMVAYTAARQRAERELANIMDEIKMKEEQDKRAKYCMKRYKAEQKPEDSKDGNYTYIRSASYESDLRSCHVCRIQRVCEKGGEKASTSALKAAAGGFSAGASVGTMISPGWGTGIGALIGGVGAGVLGAMSGGEEDFCQELESCEDVNVGIVTDDMLQGL